MKNWGRLAREAGLRGGRGRAAAVLAHPAFVRDYPWLAGWTSGTLDPRERELIPAGPNPCHGWGLPAEGIAHAISPVATAPAQRPALFARTYADVCLLREGVRWCVFRRGEVLEGVNALVVDPAVDRALAAPDLRIDAGAFIGSANRSANPAHFLCDYLARAVAFRDLLGVPEEQLCIDTEGSPLAEFATAAVVPGCRRLQPGASHAFGRLHLLASSTEEPGHPFWFMEPRLYRPVREGLLRALPAARSAAGPRLYLSRFDTPRRPLLNEQALAARLEREGFRILTMSALAPAEQLAAVRDAAMVVAPHGAALAGLVLAAAGTGVVELFNPRRGLADFAALAHGAGARYAAVFGTPERAPDGAEDAWRIDVDAVLRAIDGVQALQTSAPKV
jgi:hypothetical protein